MPELPEVETTRRGIAPALENHHIAALIVRERRLRWPVPAGLELKLRGQPVTSFSRRAKYLLMETPAGTAMIHLGMSGSMRIVAPGDLPEKHDHFDIPDGITALHDAVKDGNSRLVAVDKFATNVNHDVLVSRVLLLPLVRPCC